VDAKVEMEMQLQGDEGGPTIRKGDYTERFEYLQICYSSF